MSAWYDVESVTSRTTFVRFVGAPSPPYGPFAGRMSRGGQKSVVARQVHCVKFAPLGYTCGRYETSPPPDLGR